MRTPYKYGSIRNVTNFTLLACSFRRICSIVAALLSFTITFHLFNLTPASCWMAGDNTRVTHDSSREGERASTRCTLSIGLRAHVYF